MACSSCGKREATVHITQSVNGKTTRIELCSVCAKEQGYFDESGGLVAKGFFTGESFGGTGLNLFQMAGGMSGIPSSAFTGERCAYCGTSFEEFRSRGLLGCVHCYDEFSQRLLPVIRRIQAGEVHTGRRPAGAPAEPPKAPRGPFLKKPIRIPKKKPEGEAAPETPPAAPADAATKTASAAGSKAPKAPAAPAKPAAPAEETALQRLRREQAEAVKAEDYEKAATLRDRIRALQDEERAKGGTQG